jgi:hypothetical protein
MRHLNGALYLADFYDVGNPHLNRYICYGMIFYCIFCLTIDKKIPLALKINQYT